jgi:hypothetical protein
VAERIGTILTLSEDEQQRLTDAGILEVLAEASIADENRAGDDDPEPSREREPVAP